MAPRLVLMPNGENSLIVVVEDDDDLRPEIVDYLHRRKRRAIACATIAEARATLEKAEQTGEPPHAVISDVGLPDGDGLDLYDAFAPRLPSTRWVLMSGGHDMERVQRRLDELEELAPPIIVEKPFSMRMLQQVIADDAN